MVLRALDRDRAVAPHPPEEGVEAHGRVPAGAPPRRLGPLPAPWHEQQRGDVGGVQHVRAFQVCQGCVCDGGEQPPPRGPGDQPGGNVRVGVNDRAPDAHHRGRELL